MRAARQQRVFGALGQRGEGGKHGGQLFQEDVVRLPDEQELSRLRDVLRRRAPMHIASSVPFTDPVQFPDERHQRMARARQAGPHGLQIEIGEVRLARNLFGGAGRNDAQIGLRQGQGSFHIQPRLIAHCFREQRADARVLDT